MTPPVLPVLPGHIVYRQFTGVDDTTAGLWVATADGSQAHQVTRPRSGQVDHDPQWSPDGRHIAFTRDTPCAGVNCVVSEIYVVNSDGSNLRRLTQEPDGVGCGDSGRRNACNGNPAWSPDGRHLAYNHAQGDVVGGSIAYSWLRIMDHNGRHVHDFMRRPSAPRRYEDSGPSWSRNGLVAFERHEITSPRNSYAVFVVRADGSGVRRITPWSLVAGDNPVISPDGTHVAFHSRADIDLNDPSGVSGDVYVVGLDGHGLTRITTPETGTRYGSLTWSPDGRYLMGARFPGVSSAQPDLFVFDVRSHATWPITHDDLWQSQPDWTAH